MIKKKYHDYAVEAFKLYGAIKQPKTEKMADFRLKEYLLTRKMTLSDQQYTATLDDIRACIRVIESIKKRKDADSILDALTVYTKFNYGHRSDISHAITRVSLNTFTSTMSIYRRLSLCRTLFATERGLCSA